MVIMGITTIRCIKLGQRGTAMKTHIKFRIASAKKWFYHYYVGKIDMVEFDTILRSLNLYSKLYINYFTGTLAVEDENGKEHLLDIQMMPRSNRDETLDSK